MTWKKMAVSKCKGMSLIEVLVAFVILAMTMSVVLRINSGAVRNHQVSSQYFKAVAIAESRLEQMSTEVDLASYSQEGKEEGAYLWRYQRQPYQAWREEKLLAVPLLPVEETLSVIWEGPGGVRTLSFTRIGVIRDKR